MNPKNYRTLNTFYKSLFDNLNDGILLANPETQKFYLGNKAICKMLGYSPAEIRSLSVADIHPEGDLPSVIKQFERLAANESGDETLAEDIPMKRKDKSVFYADINFSRVKLAGEMYLVGVFRDTTENKKLEKELEDAKVAARNVLEDLRVEKEELARINAKDEALLGSIGDGVVAVDCDGRALLMNRAAKRMLGWDDEQVAGKSSFEMWKVLDEKGNIISKREHPIAAALQGKPTVATSGSSYFYTRKNGTRFPVAITVTPVMEKNKIIGAIDVFRDITQEKEVARLKDEFLDIASHELRTPMTIIKGFLDMVIKEQVGKIPTTEMKNYLKFAYVGNERMIKLVNDLLDISRIEAGRMKFDLADIQLEKVIERTVGELIKISQSKGLVLKFEKPPKPLPKITAAEDKIRMVLMNLVDNAIKYTEKGEVKIWTKADDDQIIVHIEDTGAGIAKEDQNKLFQKFFQINTNVIGGVKGSGLGLYISKMIIEKLKGKIWFQSKGEGKGSTFSFSLPKKNSAVSQRAVETIEREVSEHPDQQ